MVQDSGQVVEWEAVGAAGAGSLWAGWEAAALPPHSLSHQNILKGTEPVQGEQELVLCLSLPRLQISSLASSCLELQEHLYPLPCSNVVAQGRKLLSFALDAGQMLTKHIFFHSTSSDF